MERLSQLRNELKEAVNARDAAICRAEAATQNALQLEADRDHWKEQCTSALSRLHQTHLFHEELGRVHVSSQQEVERFQDELVTLKSVLRNQSSEIVLRDQEIRRLQQRVKELEEEVDNVQVRIVNLINATLIGRGKSTEAFLTILF